MNGEIPVLSEKWVDIGGFSVQLYHRADGKPFIKVDWDCFGLEQAITLGEMAKRYKASQELKAVLASMPEDVPQEAIESLPAGYRIVTKETYNEGAPWMYFWRGVWMRGGLRNPGWFGNCVYAQAVGDAKP